jgi:hypothetical protein
MWSFRDNRLLEPIDVTVANLMAALGRYQGRQEIYQYQAPQVLETLRQIAVVESTEASNRIEGIVVPPDRLKALMAQAVPETRSESEIAGYRDVLKRIHTGRVDLPLTPDTIRALHAYLPGEGGSGNSETTSSATRCFPTGAKWCASSRCRLVKPRLRWMSYATTCGCATRRIVRFVNQPTSNFQSPEYPTHIPHIPQSGVNIPQISHESHSPTLVSHRYPTNPTGFPLNPASPLFPLLPNPPHRL